MTRPHGRKFKAISRPLRKSPSRIFPNPTRVTATVVHEPASYDLFLPLCDEYLGKSRLAMRWTSEPANCPQCLEISLGLATGT